MSFNIGKYRDDNEKLYEVECYKCHATVGVYKSLAEAYQAKRQAKWVTIRTIEGEYRDYCLACWREGYAM